MECGNKGIGLGGSFLFLKENNFWKENRSLADDSTSILESLIFAVWSLWEADVIMELLLSNLRFFDPVLKAF